MSTAPHRLGKYEFQQLLGKGNVGEVWKAHDLSNRRNVALKIVYADLQRSDPQFLTRFMTDGQVLAALRHANLVPTLEVNVTRQAQSNEITAYLAMEYIVGQTFANYLQNTSHQSNFPALSAIVHFFTSLGLALDYAYQRKIVHGNLTPDNILLNQQDTSHFPGGEPMLTDIGLTQILGLATDTYTKLPLYLSPEQAQGYPPSQRSDVYALGVILYETYTGTVPFRGESSAAIMSQHMNLLPTPPALINSIVPSGLSEVILRAMAKDPNARYPNVSTFAAAIAGASTRQSSFNLSSQLPQKDITNQAVHQENSLLGVAQPPSPPGSSQFRSFGSPSLSGLTPKEIKEIKEISAHMPTVPSTPPPLPPLSQPTVTKPQLPAIQPQNTVTPPLANPPGAEQNLPPQTPWSVEPKKPEAQTQASSQSATPEAQQIHTLNPGAQPPKYDNIVHTQQDQAIPVAHISQMPQPPPLPQTPAPGANAPRTIRPQEQPQDYPLPTAPVWPMQESAQQLQPLSARPEQRKRNKSSLYISLVALLALVIIGGTVTAIFLQNKGNANPTSNSNNSVFFQDGSLHNDQLRINLQNIAPSPNGQTYFAWLQDTTQHTQPLGPLSVQNGSTSFLYQGDAKHTNLISITQSILITTEDTGKTPQSPSDHKVYQASIDPQLWNGLKSLLYATPDLPDQQSIVATLLDTLHSIDDKAGSIVDTLKQDSGLAKRQATRIIELLDNTQQAQNSGDLPAQYTPQIGVTIGLLSSPSQKGYLDILDTQLKQLEPLVAHDTNAQQHLTNIKSALGDLRDWLQKMHDYDVQLLKAADLQDSGTSGIALQLKQVSADSFTGHTIPPNASPQPTPGSAGARQAYTEAQYMATLSLQPA